jgi:hypothetical protein
VRTPTATPARRLTVALALLCLASQLSGLAHLAFVPHLACAEHGELVEAGPGLLPGPAPGVAESVDAASPIAAPVAGHGHAHCLLSALRRTPATLSAAPALERPAPGVEGPASLGRPERLPGALPVLAVAPKSSPPAA